MSRTAVRRSALTGVLALLVSLVSSLALVAPAHAADAYRFWGYYQLVDGKWSFATKGADTTTPKDGSVEGYRYALGDMSVSRFPRSVVTFAQACGSTPAVPGKKRVGVVVDPGRAADAREASAQVPQPYAACAVVPTAATGEQVLAAVAKPRVEKGLICAIDGYPATGCSDTVKEVPAPAKAADQPVSIPVRDDGASASATTSAAQGESTSGSSPATWIFPAVVVLLAALGALWALSRRGRRDAER